MTDINETIDQQFKNVFEEFTTISKRTKDLQDSIRILQKNCRNAEKQVKIQKKKVQVPLNLSQELETFLGVEKGTQLTKAAVMKSVSDYIKTNDLQLKENRRKFKPNKPLNKMFGMNVKESLTFVEINKHVSSHLTK